MQTQENLQYSPEIEGNKQFRPPETTFQVDGNLDLEIEASMLVGLKISTGYTMTKIHRLLLANRNIKILL